MRETIETLSGLHTMRALSLEEIAALIRAAFSPSVARAMLGDIDPVPAPVKPVPPPAAILRAQSVTGSSERGTKLRTLADAMQRDIDSKRNPATANQNLTRRRMAIIAGMRADAERMEQTQTALYALADAHDNGTTLSPVLSRETTRTGIQGLLHGGHGTDGPGKFYADELRALMANYKPVNAEEKAAEELRRGLREREKRAALQQIPGFFPTPASLSARLVALADIQPGMHVLEPSAGAGHLADEIKRQEPGAVLECYEVNHHLSEILKDKGHKVSCVNFTEIHVPVTSDARDFFNFVDRVIMNPPFENSQDIDHIRHAYNMLKPGGILAAILCEGPFFRNDSKAVSFRAWLDGNADPFTEGPTVLVSERNPDGAFMASDRPTGIATRTLVLRKPTD